MRCFVSFVAGLIVGAAAVFTSLKYHIVWANDGIHMIPKISAQFAETYVDIRHFDLGDWSEHQFLAMAIARDEKAYLLENGAIDSFRQAVDELFPMPRRKWRRP